MRVHCLLAGNDGSGFYRINEVARAANESGLDVQVTVSSEIDVDGVKDPYGEIQLRSIDVGADVEVLVLQRPLAQRMHEIARVAKKQGLALVVDVDDDFHSVHLDNVAASAVDPAKHPMHNKNWLMQTTRMADLLTISAPSLQKYAEGNWCVLRNCIPERIFDIPVLAPQDAASLRWVIGWTGTVKTHPQDLQATRRGLADPLLADYPIRIVGDQVGIPEAFGVDPDRVSSGSGWLDSVDEYWAQMRRSFGVGVVPLENSRFNKSKSYLKGMEYAALGIPFVASPAPEYTEMRLRYGVGLMAASKGQWASRLRSLLEDDKLYAEQRQAGLVMAHEMTIESNVYRWVSAWRRALAI